MKITSIKIVLQDRDTRFVGLATIALDGIILINSIKILESPNGLYLGMPSYTKKDGTHQDIAHPLNNEVRTALKNMIIDAYNYCISNHINGASFIVEKSFSGTIIEQNFSDFNVYSSHNTSEQSFIGNRHERNSNETFKNWLNS